MQYAAPAADANTRGESSAAALAALHRWAVEQRLWRGIIEAARDEVDSRSDLTVSAPRLWNGLIAHMNWPTGRTYVSLARIAAQRGMSEPTTKRAMAKFVKPGVGIAIRWQFDGRTYTTLPIILRVAAARGLTPGSDQNDPVIRTSDQNDPVNGSKCTPPSDQNAPRRRIKKTPLTYSKNLVIEPEGTDANADDEDVRAALVRVSLRQHFGASVYEGWFAKVTFEFVSNDGVRLIAPAQWQAEWIKRNHSRRIGEVCQHALGRSIRLEFDWRRVPRSPQHANKEAHQ